MAYVFYSTLFCFVVRFFPGVQPLVQKASARIEVPIKFLNISLALEDVFFLYISFLLDDSMRNIIINKEAVLSDHTEAVVKDVNSKRIRGRA